jgi:hypothetical protein
VYFRHNLTVVSEGGRSVAGFDKEEEGLQFSD